MKMLDARQSRPLRVRPQEEEGSGPRFHRRIRPQEESEGILTYRRYRLVSPPTIEVENPASGESRTLSSP